MPLNEADTRANLIDPALYRNGWTEDLTRREVSAGTIEIIGGKARRQSKGRADYVLRIKANPQAHPVAVAIIEAKAEHLPPGHGLEQARAYAESRRLHVPFVFASNGHLFVEYDVFTQTTAAPRPIAEFPTPDALRTRYEAGVGFRLDDPAAKPLLTGYPGGDESRRYYQDAAIRAALERIAAGENRALLSLATGTGKTRIAVNLLKRIADAGQLGCALFVCDRDELRKQGVGAFQAVFGSDAKAVSAGHPQNHARILIATYQTLGVDTDDGDASFLTTHYPPNFFSHIIIDECHRSAWGKWSQVLTRNPNAIQIGLTATPRQIVTPEDNPEAAQDIRIHADNIRHFGPPAYEYGMGQAMEDGYLSACEVVCRDLFLDANAAPESVEGIGQADLTDKTLRDAVTGEALTVADARERYGAGSFEQRLRLPERVAAMCRDLWEHLLATGGPHQKTIIFCASDAHADAVAATMTNLYAVHTLTEGGMRAERFAFKCTAASNGSLLLDDFKGQQTNFFCATTVDLLTTGVDVPSCRNVVFFKYVKSPISFTQMVGRGTRIDPETGKLMFRVYDYTNATRLFGADFVTRLVASTVPREMADDGPLPEHIIEAAGFDVRVTDAGRMVLVNENGRATPVPLEVYRERMAAELVAAAPTLEEFRAKWIEPSLRKALLQCLPQGEAAARLVQILSQMEAFDL